MPFKGNKKGQLDRDFLFAATTDLISTSIGAVVLVAICAFSGFGEWPTVLLGVIVVLSGISAIVFVARTIDDQSTSDRQASQPWWLVAVYSGAASIVLVLGLAYAPTELIRGALSIGIGVFLLTLMLNPSLRFIRAFWVVFGAWSTATFIPNLDLKFEEPNRFLQVLLEGPGAFFHAGSIVLMVVLLVLDNRERSQVVPAKKRVDDSHET